MGNAQDRQDFTENQLRYKPITCSTYVDGIPIDIYSVREKRHDLVEQLIGMNCQFLNTDKNGCGALHLAAKHNTNMLYMIFTNTSASNHHLYDNNLRTPLHYAVIHGHRNHFSLLRELLFDQDVHGDTALHLAVRKGCIYSVQQLLELCPALPYRYYSYYLLDEVSVLTSIVENNKHETALIYAITHEMIDMVKTLAQSPLLIDDKINGRSAKDCTVALARNRKETALKILDIIT